MTERRATAEPRCVRTPDVRPAPGRSLGLVLIVLGQLWSGPALAFSPEATPAQARPAAERADLPRPGDPVRAAAATEAEAQPTLMERISEKLRRVPLRPVMIGETPRTPADPEPGAGLTIFIRF